jgi:hypothetical protein
MLDTFTYCYLDFLPQIPKNLLEHYDNNVNNPFHVSLRNRKNNIDIDVHHITDIKLKTWLKFNICQDADSYTASFAQGTNNISSQLPHVDFSRRYTLNYILDTGGDNVLTNFYCEDGFNLLRTDIPDRSYQYKNLNLIDSVQFEPNRWHILNTKIIHGVTNIISPRISVQIGLGQTNKFVG